MIRIIRITAKRMFPGVVYQIKIEQSIGMYVEKKLLYGCEEEASRRGEI